MSDFIQDLKEEARKLVSLLEDPQPGLVTWKSFLAERIDKIAAFSGTYMLVTHIERLINECEKIQKDPAFSTEVRVGVVHVNVGLLKMQPETMKSGGGTSYNIP